MPKYEARPVGKRAKLGDAATVGSGERASFWAPLSYAELADAQGTRTIDSFDELRDGSLSDDEYHQFVAALS